MRTTEPISWEAFLGSTVESGGGHVVSLHLLLTTEFLKLLSKNCCRREVCGLVVEKGDFVFTLLGEEGSAVIGNAKADRVGVVVENDTNESRRSTGEFEKDATVDVDGVGVVEVVGDENETGYKEWPVVHYLLTAGDT